MFSPEFFPTPTDVIDSMMQGEAVQGKICLEPSAGKGNIVDWLIENGAADVIACEKHPDLRKIAASKSRIITDDFFSVDSKSVSHVDLIVMNPPFNDAVKHILHAYNIAAPGCRILALCNEQSYKNRYCKSREQLYEIVNEHGNAEPLGTCFKNAERYTDVGVMLIKITKPGINYNEEFDGFLMDDEPEQQGNGIISYNAIRDLVNRYVCAVKIYDQQLDVAVQMNNMTGEFFKSDLAMTCTLDGKPLQRNQFKKDLQKSGWNYIFDKMNMQKYATKGLKEDINKFVEKQHHIPFTMANIYRMLEIVVGTQGSRIDRAVLEVFEKITMHHHENRHAMEGWKTNSHYLLTRKFIHPSLFGVGWSGQMEVTPYSQNYETIDDLNKALCYLTGKNYDEIGSVWAFTNANRDDKKIFNSWYDFGFFRVKGFKKGTGHFEFKDEKVWALFNQRVAKLKGYALYEPKKETPKQKKETKKQHTPYIKPTILATIKITA